MKRFLSSNIPRKYSEIITKNKSHGASQAMLYALQLDNLDKPFVGIGSNWFEGNPCNNHLNILSDEVKHSMDELIGMQFSMVGVSDGISNGLEGGLYSLPSRELIADSYETMNIAHYYDGNISIPGCDKNLPGCLMGMIRVNRPSFMIYGGSIPPGKFNGHDINIVDAFQSYHRYLKGDINEKERQGIVKNACPCSGSCGGMFTANSMAVSIESMGMMQTNSSSFPALSKEKIKECHNSGNIMKYLLKEDMKPSDIITRKSIENAIVTGISLGASTNIVLHLLAIAKTAKIDIDLDIFNDIGKNIPIIGNFKPHGDYLMNDLHQVGGLSVVHKILFDQGFLHKDTMTITGKTLYENVKNINVDYDKIKHIIDVNNPIKKDSHIRILKGNLAPNGSVAKITGKEGEYFEGEAIVFSDEEEFFYALENNKIKKGHAIIIRDQGPKGGPGMPEMLKPTSAVIGYGLGNDVAFLTDGRFSGGSHGFIVGHISPESYENGPISQVHDGDKIIINSKTNTINWTKSNKLNFEDCRIKTKKDILQKNHQNTYLDKYRKLVGPAENGCYMD